VYKSSFVRTIEWFAKQGWLDRERATEYGLSICPIDFSLWSVETAAIPSWWPRSSGDTAPTDLANLPEYAECENLIEIRDNGSLLLGAEGAIIPHAERTKISSSFQLLPFAYEVHGPNLPDAKIVAAFLRRNFWQKDPTSREPLSIFFPSFDGWTPHISTPARINDLVIVPLLSRVESNNINIWNSWRGAHRPFFPASTLVSGGVPGCDTTSWFYQVGNDAVCRMRDWRIGTLEVTNANEYLLHGQFAFANRDWVFTATERHDCRVGYVLSMSLKHRKDDYAKAEKVQFHTLLNVSCLAA
jgi:hypothetical protein